MTELPRKAFSRSARLAALPLGYAGRTAVGFGRRLGGAPAETVLTEVQQRTAEQLFKTLGELKGGAMKFGQALSVLEAALPDELAAPYRENLTRLQDDAPPMPTQTVRDQLDHRTSAPTGPTTSSGSTAARPPRPASARSTRAGGSDGRDVAVKVQYPGAGEALMGDLRQIARRRPQHRPGLPRHRHQAPGRRAAGARGRGARLPLEAEAQRTFAEAFLDDPDYVIPDVVAVGGEALVTEWLESPYSLAHVIREGTQEERDHYGELLVRFLFVGPARTGMLHADPHPGNFRPIPGPDGEPGRLGILDFGAVARLPEGSSPRRWAA